MVSHSYKVREVESGGYISYEALASRERERLSTMRRSVVTFF